MASDYQAIKADNKRRYGTDVGRYGQTLLTDLYDDRTHFIYELLQNAEDALRRRNSEQRARTVQFDLSKQALHVSHYGKPFDRRDVESICGIAKSTKEGDLTRIGRFGIGFKSVYGFTDRPEIHSGDEDFGIDSFVWPSAQPAIERHPDQTIFIMPLRDREADGAEIAEGLRRINLDTLLFLREIDTIEWSVVHGQSGTYVRQSDQLDGHVRRVTLVGASTGHDDAEQDWLVFSKSMHAPNDELAGCVEVAFSMKDDRILPTSRSPLVVFFPTAVETNLGLRVQGPYRTTPSRDNVPKSDTWNQACVANTGELLVEALLWLRDHDLLTVDVLQCLPSDKAKFGEDSMFRPLYTTIKRALSSKRLLPLLGGGYARADKVKLGRSKDLRELINGKQLKQLFDGSSRVSWLTDLISQDRTPELRRYLMEDLDVEEVTPQTMLPRLRRQFLDRQSNAWMCRLYEFLNRQAALHRQAKVAPIIRLSDGRHAPALADGVPQVFLPGAIRTGFPTLHKRACRSADARQFLGAIGLSEPHLVDDVILNVLPKYDEGDVCMSDSQYAEDIERILTASQMNVSDKRKKLVERLRKTRFVRATHTGNGAKCFALAAELYFATERLKALFADMPGLKMVDERCSALRGDGMRALLEECGAVRYLRPVKKDYSLWNSPVSNEFLDELREQSGHPETSWRSDTIVDWELSGLEDVLAQLPSLDTEDQRIRSTYIWEELVQLEERRGRAVFKAEYRWTHYGSHRQEFDSAFIRQLSDSAWIPTAEGLRRPDLVLFDSLGWRDDPFMQSKIRFKPPIVDQLAEEAGFEPAMLHRLKQLGITNLSELEKLGLPDDEEAPSDVNSVADAVSALGVTAPESSAVEDSSADMGSPGSGGPSIARRGPGDPTQQSGGDRRQGTSGDSPYQRETQSATSGGNAPFISYVAVDHEDDKTHGLTHEERVALEEAAIEFILSQEQDWRRTPVNNEGFDLVKVAGGQACGWCEVKAMKGSLQDRPVGLSHAQFRHAQEHGDACWLYVVEHAGTKHARIVRIQDPAGKARTFTFDKGWLNVAKVD